MLFQSYLLTSGDSYNEHFFHLPLTHMQQKFGLKMEETFKLVLIVGPLDKLKHSVVTIIHLNCNFFFPYHILITVGLHLSECSLSGLPIIWIGLALRFNLTRILQN